MGHERCQCKCDFTADRLNESTSMNRTSLQSKLDMRSASVNVIFEVPWEIGLILLAGQIRIYYWQDKLDMIIASACDFTAGSLKETSEVPV